ncbi:nuclear transport factor 2 family protein [Aquimarina gracilis]|uniref:Nuclear transport factor 2 family protein n=1 Tax=Aquimarina gracilis TaxID=874422 RepID=A0ABU5ZTR0_9FLAO|nr:nuclear transport factor 2 family protein [Aquimarina gracilis]MEB3345470.1 nuclear transport factor 2 family protein [Aquimarina gracilis]
MKLNYISVFVILMFFSCTDSGTKQFTTQIPEKRDIRKQLHKYNEQIIDAAITKSFDKISGLYAEDALLMAEFHPLIQNTNNIKGYYNEIFEKESLKKYTREIIEVIVFENRVIEIGLFTKTLSNTKEYKGKYLNVWKLKDKQLTLKAEAFGYLNHIKNPEALIAANVTVSKPYKVNIPWEMEAYNALNKTNVMDRIPERSANGYTEDAKYLPFADTIKVGKSALLKHYQAYYKNPAKIDSLQVWTYDYDVVDNGYIRYTGFYVDWTVPGFSGNTQGLGISYWQRLEDNTLRIHRQIGTHIHQKE